MSGYAAANPAARQLPGSRASRPHTATTGTPAVVAAAAHARGGLAVQGLAVQAALAGDHEARPRQGAVEAGQLQEQLDARAQRGAEHGERGEAHPAGGAGPGLAPTRSAPVSPATSSAQRVSPASSRATSPGSAPFCGA